MTSPDRDWERWLERKGVLGEPWAGLADRGVPFTWEVKVVHCISDQIREGITATPKTSQHSITDPA